MSSKRFYMVMFALACFAACYANVIESKSEAISLDINDARDFATAEAKAKLEVVFAPVLEAIVTDYEDKIGDYTIPSQDLIKKVSKSVFNTYIHYEQKVSKMYNDGHESYYALVTTSIESNRLLMAMESYLLPKAGDNRRGHERKVKQLRQVIEAEFDAYNQPSIDDAVPARRSRKLGCKR